MKILLIGHVCIDVNESEHAAYTDWGSALMYMAHYFQKYLSTTPTLLAPYGKDFQQYTQGIVLLSPPQEAPTLIYKNHTHNNKRVQQAEHSDSAQPLPLTKDTQAAIADADIICVAPLLPNYSLDYLQNILRFRKKGSLAVLLPQGYFRRIDTEGRVTQQDFAEAETIIPLFDLVIFSETDHPQSLQVAKQWAKQSSSLIIVCQASRGASWITSDGTIHAIKTNQVPEDQIVDSVGCGDIFSAATIATYFSTRDIIPAVKAGNKAARDKLFIVGV